MDHISTLNELKNCIKNCDHSICNELKQNTKNCVFSSGLEHSSLMIIGEASGKNEDELSVPFVGAAGQLLDKMLKWINIDRNKVYVTNVVNYRPENNKTPTMEQIQFFSHFLHKTYCTSKT